MKKEMYPVRVEKNDKGNIVIIQEWNDMNMDDPEVEVTPEQLGLLTSWLLEATAIHGEETNESSIIPASVWMGGPESEHQELDIYQNTQGMVVLKISDEMHIELSPIMAKRLRERLTKAIGSSFVDMLKNDSDV